MTKLKKKITTKPNADKKVPWTYFFVVQRSTHFKFHSGLKVCGLTTLYVAITSQQMVFCKVNRDIRQTTVLSFDAYVCLPYAPCSIINTVNFTHSLHMVVHRIKAMAPRANASQPQPEPQGLFSISSLSENLKRKPSMCNDLCQAFESKKKDCWGSTTTHLPE